MAFFSRRRAFRETKEPFTHGPVLLEANLSARRRYAQSALQKVHEAIREGEPFAPTLRATRCVDSIVSNMIDVGEETGDLDKMLMKIADNYDEQVNVLVGSLVSLLEPVMVVALGGIVGTIVVALFMPLAKILGELSNPPH